MLFLLIFASVCAINRCTALDLQQQLMLQSAISYLETQFEDLSNSTKPECKTALLETFQGVRGQKYWALKFVDSIPKIPSGILQGNIRHYGSYDECLSVRNEDATIQGKYCLVTVGFTDKLTNDAVKNLSSQFKSDVVDLSRIDVKVFNNSLLNFFGLSKSMLSWGLCIPHVCDGADITAFFDHIIYANFEAPIARLFGLDEFCETSDPKQIPLGDLLAMIGFGTVFAIAGASTVYDVLVYQKRKLKGPDFWICFSFLTNGRKLFVQKRPHHSISSLNGIRAVACVLVIVAHVRQFNWMSPHINSIIGVTYDAVFSIRSIVLVAGPSTIDTFLLISGMLVSYKFFKEAQTEVKTLSGLPAFYFHRLIRLWPPIIAITIYQLSIHKWLGEGPGAIPNNGHYKDSCHWWAPILFVSNWIPNCITHTWYLAVDMQLFLISPIFLFALLRKPKLGYSLLALTLSMSIGYAIYVSYVYRLSMTSTDYFLTPADVYARKLYLATHSRMTGWLIGIAYGHFIHTKVSKRLLNHTTNIVGWFIAISIFLFYMITHHSYSLKTQGLLFMSVYSAFHRPLWALAVAYIIYSCTMGYGSLANYVLSLNVFRILSNLSYSMFLTHLCAVSFIVWARYTPTHMSDMRNFLDLCSSYVLSFVSAVPFALCFEYPFMAMESYFMKRGKQVEPTTDITLTTIQTISEKDN